MNPDEFYGLLNNNPIGKMNIDASGNVTGTTGLGSVALPKVKGTSVEDMQFGSWDNSVPKADVMQQIANNGATSNALQKQYVDYATGANAKNWSDVNSLGDFGSWLTDNRGGGSNYLSQGLGALGVGVNAWSAYNENKYKNKLLDLQDNAQKFYEDQVNRQNQKQDTAQTNYNAAQAK